MAILQRCIYIYVTRHINRSMILDLSPDGHKFLADIKVDQNWKKTKAIATRVGSYSLNALESIASGVTSAMIDRYFRGV